MERQRNPGSMFEPLDRSRMPLRYIPSSLPGLTGQSMLPFSIAGLAAEL
jgi:hypothetical protein